VNGRGHDPVLDCRALTVGYGAEPVLSDLDLTVARGETVALLGPSGSGKTTLLYTIAGFLRPSSGEIWIAGTPVHAAGQEVPPEARDVGVVFQHYALWPHLSAVETVAYPFRRIGMAEGEARRRAQALLETMGIGELAARRPAELSGGQQQRIGLARALARNAGLYLFDEPTAHLDAALRTALQAEVVQRRGDAGAAALYATHDAGEALAVADRVVLLQGGRIVQIGSPADIYERPVDVWAARLTGPASVIEVDVTGTSPRGLRMRVAGDDVVVSDATAAPGRYMALVRPDWAALGGPLAGRMMHAWYRGPHTDYRVQTAAGDVVLRGSGPPRARPGEPVDWRLDRVHLINAEDHGRSER